MKSIGDMRHNLNSLTGSESGSIWVTTIGVIKWDTRRLDYGSCSYQVCGMSGTNLIMHSGMR